MRRAPIRRRRAAPGLSQIAFETPSRPKPVHQTRPPERADLASAASPSCARRGRRQIRRPRARGRGCTATSDRRSPRPPRARRRTARRDSTTASDGSASITASQVPHRRRGRRGSRRRPRRSESHEAGSNCPPARLRASAVAASTPPTRCATSTNSASCAMPRGDRDGLPASSPGQPLPSHCSYARAERLEDAAGRPSSLASAARHRRVAGDHLVDLAVARERELQADPEPVERRVPGPSGAFRQRRRARRAARGVLVGLQRDVVAEPLRLLVGVGVAPDVDSSAV